MEKIIQSIKEASVEAGKLIMEVFDTDFDVVKKIDDTPLTVADQKASDLIMKRLEYIEFPMISEESQVPSFEVRKTYKDYFLIDPLDGTKEFVNNRTDFTVNIAWMRNHYPLWGCIYHPVDDVLYYGGMDYGAFKQTNKRYEEIKTVPPKSQSIDVLVSHSHINEDTQKYLDDLEQAYGNLNLNRYGSSLKICKVAEGKAQLYPRLGTTMEWDTAAVQAILEGAGGKLINFIDNKRLKYNHKEHLKNPWFLAKN